MEPKKRSIVMVDWARDNEPTARSRNQFLWDLMLLSLLYDDILVQDEIILCSNKLPAWFPDTPSFLLLEEIIDIGPLKILKRPQHRYPKRLQELASNRPISARREHLAKHSVNNDGKPIAFTAAQHAFHNRVEAFLKNRPSAHRFAGSSAPAGHDIMRHFGKLLRDVLTNTKYDDWRRDQFPTITPRVADKFADLISDPKHAIDHLRGTPDGARYTPRPGTHVLNTAIAVQLARTFPTAANHLQDLIETVFARPFCEEEDADGRYGTKLRDLPLLAPTHLNPPEVVYRVDTITSALHLPRPGRGVARVIATVREMESGKRLRKAMRRLHKDTDFRYAITAWGDVADDIARTLTAGNRRPFRLQHVLFSVAESLLWATFTYFTRHPQDAFTEPGLALKEAFADGALHGAYAIAGDAYFHRLNLSNGEVRQQFEKSIRWATVPHATIPH
jgi:hypothetical protein